MEQPSYEKALAHPRVQARVSEIVKAVVNENLTRRDLAERSGLRSDLFRHVFNRLQEKAGLREASDGRWRFDDAILGIDLPPTAVNGRDAWEMFTGRSAPENLGRFVFEARKAIGAATVETNITYSCWNGSNNNKKCLSTPEIDTLLDEPVDIKLPTYESDYIEPDDLPPILRRPTDNRT